MEKSPWWAIWSFQRNLDHFCSHCFSFSLGLGGGLTNNGIVSQRGLVGWWGLFIRFPMLEDTNHPSTLSYGDLFINTRRPEAGATFRMFRFHMDKGHIFDSLQEPLFNAFINKQDFSSSCLLHLFQNGSLQLNFEGYTHTQVKNKSLTLNFNIKILTLKFIL